MNAVFVFLDGCDAALSLRGAACGDAAIQLGRRCLITRSGITGLPRSLSLPRNDNGDPWLRGTAASCYGLGKHTSNRGNGLCKMALEIIGGTSV